MSSVQFFNRYLHCIPVSKILCGYLRRFSTICNLKYQLLRVYNKFGLNGEFPILQQVALQVQWQLKAKNVKRLFQPNNFYFVFFWYQIFVCGNTSHLEFKHSSWAGSQQVCILFVEVVASSRRGRRIKDESQTAFRKLHTFFAECWLGVVRALKKRPIS